MATQGGRAVSGALAERAPVETYDRTVTLLVSTDVPRLGGSSLLDHRWIQAEPGSTDGRRRERHQVGAMARRPMRGKAGCLLSVGNVASVPRWGRAAGGERWIQAEVGC